MTTTVRWVAEERPDLRRLTFCIPANLSSGTAGGTRTPGYTRYERRVASWKEATAGAEKIEFVLKQGSDLLDRLASPKHAGRAWFWWHEPYLGPDWLAGFQRAQAKVAGDRCRPFLQVDVPIQDDFRRLASLSRTSLNLTDMPGWRWSALVKSRCQAPLWGRRLLVPRWSISKETAEVRVVRKLDKLYVPLVELIDALQNLEPGGTLVDDVVIGKMIKVASA